MACTCHSLEFESFDKPVAYWFQECLFEWQERASFYIGMTSLLFWIMCQLPQFIKNYHAKSTEGLAALLLIQWLFGDTTNLIVSVLNRQLAFQKLSAALFVCMDVTMLLQKLIYLKNGPIDKRTIVVGNAQPLLVVALAMLLLSESAHASLSRIPDEEEQQVWVIPSCEPNSTVSDSALFAGNVLGWVSSCFYVGSRVAQIRKNWQRQSTEGVASTMFMFAIMGNLTYSAGIMLRPDRVMSAMPWLVGSLTCMGMDIFIVSQSYYYALKKPEVVVVPEPSIRSALLDSDQRDIEQTQD